MRGGVLARSFDVTVQSRYGTGYLGAVISEAIDVQHQGSSPADAIVSSMHPLRPLAHTWAAPQKCTPSCILGNRRCCCEMATRQLLEIGFPAGVLLKPR
jgi:hypothetical protein